MNAAKRSTRLVAYLGAVAMAVVLTGCAPADPSSPGSLDGKTLVNQECGRCHPLERVKTAKKDRSAWTATVGRMRSNGLDVTNEQAAAIVDYLTTRDGGQ
ncbi:MAG: hypothetical protein HGB10_06910 [Coriobacteriia bacterium]|nr:hypothetical protein [Coriobacteriia bacterium]